MQLLAFLLGRRCRLRGRFCSTRIGLGLLLGGALGVVVGVHRLGLCAGGLLPGGVGLLGNGVAALDAIGQGIGGGLLLQAGLDHDADARGLLVGRLADLGQLGTGGGGRGSDVLDRLGEPLQLALTLFQVSAQAQGKLDITAVVHRSASRWVGCRHARAREAGCNFDEAKRSRPQAAKEQSLTLLLLVDALLVLQLLDRLATLGRRGALQIGLGEVAGLLAVRQVVLGDLGGALQFGNGLFHVASYWVSFFRCFSAASPPANA
ncbi:hypothetical protein FQZ97_766730 [compost metagenome]